MLNTTVMRKLIPQILVALGLVVSGFFLTPRASAGTGGAIDCYAGPGMPSFTKTGIAVPKTGLYKVWVRMKASEVGDSYIGVEVNPVPNKVSTWCYGVGYGPPALSSADWEWRTAPVSVNLTSLSNDIRVFGTTTAGVKIDRLLLVSEAANCIPDNIRTPSAGREPGDNCLPSKGQVSPVISPVIPPVVDGFRPSLALRFDWVKGRYYISVDWPRVSTTGATYKVLRNSNPLSTTMSNHFSDYAIGANNRYSYQITSLDAGGSVVSTSTIASGVPTCLLFFCQLGGQ